MNAYFFVRADFFMNFSSPRRTVTFLFITKSSAGRLTPTAVLLRHKIASAGNAAGWTHVSTTRCNYKWHWI